ncbi:hypothetical protein ACIRVF_33460 [Kitasatospora sp. NPDC101157]|uniref:hypothetical protein n=1 Tax=Kitasatospora sp. NPDC101157 TaxID=3364098 RepID=UPI0038276D83
MTAPSCAFSSATIYPPPVLVTGQTRARPWHGKQSPEPRPAGRRPGSIGGQEGSKLELREKAGPNRLERTECEQTAGVLLQGSDGTGDDEQ